jgi:hypothetical protein
MANRLPKLSLEWLKRFTRRPRCFDDADRSLRLRSEVGGKPSLDTNLALRIVELETPRLAVDPGVQYEEFHLAKFDRVRLCLERNIAFIQHLVISDDQLSGVRVGFI